MGENEEATRTPKSHVKKIRQQPKGLQMRYRPFGDDPSSDETDSAPRFKIPPVILPTKTMPFTEPGPIENGFDTAPIDDGIKLKKTADTTKENRDAQDTPKSRTKPTSKKRKSIDPDKTLLNKSPSMEPLLDETVDKIAHPKKRKKEKKESRSSASKNTWEAEEARRILAMSKKPDKHIATPSAKSEDVAIENKAPEVAKSKRKKRKSEATEEL